MKIELKSPFREFYKSGYLNINKEPRRLIVLIGKNNERETISYARYLMSVSKCRFLNKQEHVDHIDGNKLNDEISNLQILSQKENNLKSIIQNGKKAKYIKFKCPVCGNEFERKRHNFAYRPEYIPTCSRKCGGIKSHI